MRGVAGYKQATSNLVEHKFNCSARANVAGIIKMQSGECRVQIGGMKAAEPHSHFAGVFLKYGGGRSGVRGTFTAPGETGCATFLNPMGLRSYDATKADTELYSGARLLLAGVTRGYRHPSNIAPASARLCKEQGSFKSMSEQSQATRIGDSDVFGRPIAVAGSPCQARSQLPEKQSEP